MSTGARQNQTSSLINKFLLHCTLRIQSELVLQSFSECIKNFKTSEISESEKICFKRILINKKKALESFR